MKNFWRDLPRPFTSLAPLDGVTDVVFRNIVTETGKPDVLFTEFTAVDGLLSNGSERVSERLMLEESQKPIVAQIWGTDPDKFYVVAKKISKNGFAGIDINMGCPERTIIKQGACSALIKSPMLAKEIIKATIKGAGDLPVSVKTRIGFSSIDILWIKHLLSLKLPALTFHLRTVSEMSKVPAHWDMMSEVIKLRNAISPETIIIGNGDVLNLSEIYEKYKKYGCEGFMVGRGIFINPWMFNKTVDMKKITVLQRIDLYLHHIDLFEKQWGTRRNFALLKKFAKTYLSNFPGASEVRDDLMISKKIEELKEKLNEYRKLNS